MDGVGDQTFGGICVAAAPVEWSEPPFIHDLSAGDDVNGGKYSFDFVVASSILKTRFPLKTAEVVGVFEETAASTFLFSLAFRSGTEGRLSWTSLEANVENDEFRSGIWAGPSLLLFAI